MRLRHVLTQYCHACTAGLSTWPLFAGGTHINDPGALDECGTATLECVEVLLIFVVEAEASYPGRIPK